MTTKSWPMALFALAGAGVVFFAFVAIPWMADTCDGTKLEAGKPLMTGPGGCFEFWLNRYQGLLGVFATVLGVAAAIWAGRWALQQVEIANKNLEHVAAQTKMLSAQTAGVRANELTRMEGIIDKIVLLDKEIGRRENGRT
ncbi:hypothetical protein [Methylobacterium komagatae]